MKRKITFLTAALALLAFLAIPMGMWGQSTKTEGFETKASATNYQGTVTITANESDCGIGWTIYYGNVSTTGPITGSKSAQMRWYKSALSNYPYLESTTAIDGLTNVAFKAKVGNTDVKMDVNYSSDGENWIALATAVTFANTDVTDCSYTIPSGGKYIKIGVSSSSTAPNGSYYSLLVDDVVFTYSGTVNTYTVTYHPNVVGTTDVQVVFNEGDDVTVAANTFTNPGYAFTEWNTESDGSGDSYAPGDEIEDIDDDIDLYAQWEVSTSTTGTINFGSATGSTAINNTTVTGNDSQNNTWTITSVFGSAGTSFTQNASYSQVGSSSKPATSITFTTTLPEEVNITAMEAKFGGFSGTAGTITMKVGNSTIGTGSLNATNDVVVNSTSTAIGDELIVTVTGISKGVKAYYISYTYEATTPSSAVVTTTTISVPDGFNNDLHNGTNAGTLSATVTAESAAISGATVTWSSSNTDVATVGESTGVVTLVAAGTTIITASYAGVEDQYRPSSDTYELSVIDSYAPGTENNPYTVAQARAAIDANTGTQGVYATGIVSAIPTAWNSQYSNITFNFVDNDGDTDFLQAYRCGSGTGVDASTVAVGDIVVVYGNLTKYGSTYEFGQDCQLVSLTHPVSTEPSITVTPATINAPADGANGTLAIAYENIPDLISFDYYFCDANGDELEDTDPTYPDWIHAEINEPGEEEYYTISYIIDANQGEARTAYFKVYTMDTPNEEEVYAIVTVSQAEYEAPNVTWNLSIDETVTATTNEMTWTSAYATMAVEKGSSTTATNNYYPGTEGHSYTSTRFYTGSVLTIAPVAGYAISSVVFTATTEGYANALGSSTWTNATASVEGTTVTVTPTSGAGAIQATIGATCGFTQVKVYYEQHQVEAYDLTILLNENIPSIFVFDVNDQNNPVIENGAAGTVQVLEGTSILVSPDVAEGYVLETLMVNDENVISQLDESGAYTFTMPAESVTISATAVENVPPTPGVWVMVGLNDLTENDVFVIVGIYDEDESSCAMPNNGTGAPSAVEVTMVGNTLSGDIADNLKWNLSIEEDGYTFYPEGETETWLYCNNTNNGVRVGDNENNVFSMTPEGYLYNNATDRYIGIYNHQDWRCYTSINNNIKNQTFAFFKRVDEDEIETRTLDIVGYGNSDGGYYLIASPVAMVRPTEENGFLTNAYDLYYFDQAQEEEWRNYEAKHFNIASGKGYLYASQESTMLIFTGVPYQGNGEVALDYTEGGSFAGWNLIGNPYDMDANLYVRSGDVYDEADYYVMNIDGDNFELANRSINPMEGVMVEATAANEIACFTNGRKRSGQGMKLNLRVSDNNGDGDNARIRFGEGRTLSKFMLNENDTKLYFTKDGEDFAVVRSINENATPVSFHAAENGTYTISINAEDVEMEYLHLIDHMTGADIDLLATPSYTFDARTTDYANRFNLVYATCDDVNENTTKPFAFFDGSEWVINNEGNATLQVIDVTGRMLNSETLNGNARISLDQVSGVYVMRLVSGNDVKVQKVIIK